MKVKEINRTAVQSWSPAQHHPVYLATGTSAQQLDASFSTHASLELFELDLSDPGLDMKSCGSFASPHRYHKLVWGPHGMDGAGQPSGVLIAGGENGNVILYDPAAVMAGRGEVVVAQSERHTGPVRALDVNPFQTNLVASGGNESEIYIWDMNNFGSPMTPGPKTQPLEDISCVAWNRQVQHILASASPSGRASVWDLRKNDLIIKVSDHSNRMRCSGLAWNPDVATQMAVASEDDRLPVIQMWDLRFASSPLKVLEHHTRGVLSIAWSLADPDLLLSCGKDNRILCWNPGTAEVLYELPTSSQWCFDVQWCPRNPALLSAAAFDGRIHVYSIMGGSEQAQSQRHADQISTSFGNMDPFGTGQPLPPLQLPPAPPAPAAVNPLKKPPKWIRRPVGASFAFGGKLVSLENVRPQPPQPAAATAAAHLVHVSQVVTETAFLRRSEQLQETLSSGRFLDFCRAKIDGAENAFEKSVWSFLKANFEDDVRSRYLELLGYNKEELALKITAALEETPAEPPKVEAAAPAVAPAAPPQPVPDLSFLPPTDTPEAAFDLIAAAAAAATDLQPAATLELNGAAEPEAEEAPVEKDAEEEEKVPAGEVVDEVLPEAVEEVQLEEEEELVEEKEEPLEEEEEEEIPLEQEVVAPAEEEEKEEEGEEPSPPADDPPPVQDSPLIQEVPPSLEGVAAPDAPPDAASLFDAPAPPDASSLFDSPPAPDAASLFDAVAPPDTSSLFDAPAPAEASALFDAAAPADASALFDAAAPADASAFFDVPALVETPAALEVTAPVVEVPTPIEVPPPAPTPSGGVSLSISKDVDGLITQALLTGDFEGAVELCLHDNRMADSIILAIAGGSELLEKTQKKYFTRTHSRITKLISAVVTKDWHDVLRTCELHSWKEALAAVMTYAQPHDFSSLCDLLGGRLDAAADPALQCQACLCYICAGNVEKLVSCWSRSQDGPSPLSLQDLVEKVVVLRRAVEQTQRAGPAAIGSLLAEKMSRYAALLASQGSLATAIAYLPDDSDQVAIRQLRERLGRALGQPAAAPVAVQTQLAPAQPPAPRAPVASAAPRHPFAPTQPAMVPQPVAAAPAAAPPHYYQPVRAASTVTSWSNQTPTALLNVPPPPLQTSEQQVEPPRSMHGMPAAAPPPASSTPAYVSHQYQPCPQVSQYPPGGGGVPLYQPHLYPSSSAPPPPPPPPAAAAAEPSSPPPPPPPGFLSHYTSQPAPPFYPGQHAAMGQGPASPPPLFYPSSSSSSSSFHAPLSSGAPFQHGGPGSPGSYLPPPPPPPAAAASGVSGPQNGWNDPPALTRAPKKKQQLPQTYTPLAPITAPIMAPLGADPHAQPPAAAAPSGAPQGAAPSPHGGGGGAQVPYSGMQQQQQLSPPPINAATPKTSQEGAPGAPTGDVIQPPRSLPAEKIAKKPIPDEHLVLKTTFEGLIQKCLAVAADPQTKRKLDDANKRLEALYDKLREQTLSPAIVGGLHNMARSIETRSYAESLNIHTHIVSSSNFSETSAFMPVLKVVLTQANKLGV